MLPWLITSPHTLGDLGRAVGRLDQNIAAFGTQCRRNSLGESVNSAEELGTSLDTDFEVLDVVSQESEAGN